MINNLEILPGDYVINPLKKKWGLGQVQTIIGNRITVNFEHKGKLVINSQNCILIKTNKKQNEKKNSN